MEWLKRNWYWVIPAACIVGYFVWVYVKSKLEIGKKMEGVRSFRIPKDVKEEITQENASNN